MAIEVIISGFVIGIFFGWILQRGRMCFNSAFRDPLVFRDYSLLKAVFAGSFAALWFLFLRCPGILVWQRC